MGLLDDLITRIDAEEAEKNKADTDEGKGAADQTPDEGDPKEAPKDGWYSDAFLDAYPKANKDS